MSLCCHDENRDQFYFLDKGFLDLDKRLLKTNSNEGEDQPERKITLNISTFLIGLNPPANIILYNV